MKKSDFALLLGRVWKERTEPIDRPTDALQGVNDLCYILESLPRVKSSSPLKTYIIDGDSFRTSIINIRDTVTEDLYVHEKLARSSRRSIVWLLIESPPVP